MTIVWYHHLGKSERTEVERLEAEVERLKAELARIRGLPRLAALDAEIEGLREEVAILRTTEAAEIERLNKAGNELAAIIRQQGFEIERLRAALQSLTHDPPASLAREPDTDCEVILKMREIARRALEPKP